VLTLLTHDNADDKVVMIITREGQRSEGRFTAQIEDECCGTDGGGGMATMLLVRHTRVQPQRKSCLRGSDGCARWTSYWCERPRSAGMHSIEHPPDCVQASKRI